MDGYVELLVAPFTSKLARKLGLQRRVGARHFADLRAQPLRLRVRRPLHGPALRLPLQVTEGRLGAVALSLQR